MGKIGSPEHEAKLDETKNELEEKGWRVIKLFGKSPDAIAVKDGEIIAVEILKQWKKERTNPKLIKRHGKLQSRYYGGMSKANKRYDYRMFDDVVFGVFYLN